MIVYLFRLNPTAEYHSGITLFFNFLCNLSEHNPDIYQFNYLPSKKVAVIASNESIITKLSEWIVDNAYFKLEFEEHQEGSRKLIQWDPTIGKSFNIQYLLPLFTPESYLEL